MVSDNDIARGLDRLANRFIKEYYGRILKQNSCDSQPLFLSSTDHQASLSNGSGIPGWEPLDRGMYIGLPRSLFNFFITSIQPAVPDIVHNVSMEQWCILWYNSNSSPDAGSLHWIDILIVNQNPAWRWPVEFIKKSENSRFPTPRRTDNGHLRPGWDLEAQIFEDRAIRMISKIYIFEAYRTSSQHKGWCIWWVLIKIRSVYRWKDTNNERYTPVVEYGLPVGRKVPPCRVNSAASLYI